VRTAAILPVKSFTRAKQRLSSTVADALRRELAAAMVLDVLAALARTDAIERTIVVTREQHVVPHAREHGAILIEDQAEAGQSAAVTLGVHRALGEGFERVLCVPGDCPALDPAELDALLGAPARAGSRDRERPAQVGAPARAGSRDRERPAQVVIIPDRHGTGTNGLLLSPPQAIAPSFGPDSCERHRALARAAGIACRIERLPSLLLDIDTRADLDALRARLSGHRAGALRTRALLGQPERSLPLSINTPA